MQEGKEERQPRRVELTERDLIVLKWIGEQYAVGLDQVARLLGARAGAGAATPGKLSESATRVWLQRMVAVGAVEQDKPFRAMPVFTWLTTSGLHLVNLDFKATRPKPSTLNHLYWCSQARLYLAARRPGDVWRSERYLRRDHAQAQAQAGKERRHKIPDLPDAHLITQRGPIAIEVELTDKQQIRADRLVSMRATEYYTVWYFCSPATEPIITRSRDKLPESSKARIAIYSLDILKNEEN